MKVSDQRVLVPTQQPAPQAVAPQESAPAAPQDALIAGEPEQEKSWLQKVGDFAKNIFGSRLEAKFDESGKIELINTTGDTLNPEGMMLKSQAVIVEGKDGQPYVFVGVDEQGNRRWLPKSEFRESDGPDGLLYLPEYRNSKMGAAISGGMRGAVSLAPLGPVAMAVGAGVGAGSGVLAQMIPTDSTAVKALAGAGIAATALATAGLLVGGAPAVLGMAIVGAFLGATGALGGEGQGRVRDANYAGTMMGAMVPEAALALPVAAALGAKAENPIVQSLASAGLSAGLTAAKVALVGGNPVAIGVAAVAGAIAPAAGRVTMNVIRNLGQGIRKVLKKPLEKLFQKLPSPVLRAFTGLPAAFLAGTLGMIGGPAVAMVSAAVAGVGSVVISTVKDHLKKKEQKRQEALAAEAAKQIPEAQQPGANAAGAVANTQSAPSPGSGSASASTG